MHALRTLHRLVGSASAAVPHARSMTIHRLTMLKVADNSGAKEIKCIGHVRKSVSRLGDTIRAVVKSARAGEFHLDLGTGGLVGYCTPLGSRAPRPPGPPQPRRTPALLPPKGLGRREDGSAQVGDRVG